MAEEIVANDKILNFVDESRTIIKGDRYVNGFIKDLKKDYSDKSEKLEETLLDLMGEIDPKTMRTDFSDNKWKSLTKTLADPNEFAIVLTIIKKRVDNLKKKAFFSKLKKDYPNDEEVEQTKEVIKKINIKTGEELTQLYFKK